MGRIRAGACARLGATIHYLADQDPAAANRLQSDFPSARIGPSSEISWRELDAVFICTPPVCRGPVELEAIANGVAFFVEKPVGLSVAQMLDVARRLKEHPVPNGVGYMNRHRAGVNALRGRLAGQTPIGFTAHWVNGIYSVPWWRQPELSGGSLNEQATHFIDLTRYLLGEIVEVAASARPHPDHPDIVGEAAIQLRLQSGAAGALVYSCRAAYKSMAFRIFTDAEELALEGWDVRATLPEAISEAAPDDRYAIFEVETSAFLNRLDRTDEPGLCDIADALKTQAVADAIARSLVSGGREPVQQSIS